MGPRASQDLKSPSLIMAPAAQVLAIEKKKKQASHHEQFDA